MLLNFQFSTPFGLLFGSYSRHHFLAKMTHHKSTLRIIIAASEAPLRHILSHSLKSLGAEVEEVFSHKTLTHKLLHNHYDIAITRFAAPLLDGQQWKTIVRAKGHTTQLWVIADTLSAQESVALIERGANQIFSLPISTTRLRYKIEQLISKNSRQCSFTP